MWPNIFEKLRQKRATRVSVPAPEARILAESTRLSRSPFHSANSNPYSDYTSSSSFGAYPPASPPSSMSMSSSAASPPPSTSLPQASPYYAWSSNTPSPLGSTLVYVRTPSPQPLTPYTYSSLQRPPLPSPPITPLHQELGIAPSRADEIFIARQYDATERRIARIVPDGLARAGRGGHNQEEDTGATVYTVAEEYLQNMRQALTGPPVVITAIHPCSGPSAPVIFMPAITPLPATGSVPATIRKDSIVLLPKIEEGKEPYEEPLEINTEDKSYSASDEHERHVSTPGGDTIPELSSGSTSPASLDTFPSPISENGLDIDGHTPSSRGLDNEEWKLNWKIPTPLSSVDWMDELKEWKEEIVGLLTRIGHEQQDRKSTRLNSSHWE